MFKSKTWKASYSGVFVTTTLELLPPELPGHHLITLLASLVCELSSLTF
jgi:hypothetical protein